MLYSSSYLNSKYPGLTHRGIAPESVQRNLAGTEIQGNVYTLRWNDGRLFKHVFVPGEKLFAQFAEWDWNLIEEVPVTSPGTSIVSTRPASLVVKSQDWADYTCNISASNGVTFVSTQEDSSELTWLERE